MDQAEPSPLPGQPGEPQRQTPSEEPLGDRRAAGNLDHPVVAGYDGSPSSRNALAYAAGVSRRLAVDAGGYVDHHERPGEPLTGQVIGLPRARTETERWLLAELDQVCDRTGIEVCVITRRGNPARELAAVADQFSADALVIGAPGQRWHQVAGSVPGWLTRHAHCPVIVVP